MEKKEGGKERLEKNRKADDGEQGERQSHGPCVYVFPMFLARRLSYLTPRMRIVPVPVRQDNYAYLLIDTPTNKAAAVDVYDVSKVSAAAQSLGVSIVAAITTHWHDDHSGGNHVRVVSH
jgi:glyoxylase-like metal-dependent hydrolase (beta-lactamase superfamily II)